MREGSSLALLAAIVLVAVARPRRVPEAVVAVPAAALLVGLHAVSWSHAHAEVERLGPVVGFLAAVLVLAGAADADGVFRAAGSSMAMRARGSPRRLLLGVFVVASVTTAALSLDTTVVLLTPIVVVTARRSGIAARAPAYACVHLANSASLLMPVSNLTNLLAIAVVPVSFARFTSLMALPWLVVIALEFVGFRLFFRADLRSSVTAVPPVSIRVPRFAACVVMATLAGFVVTSFAGVAPVWAATGGAGLLAGKRLLRRETSVREVLASAAPAFCIFVLALAVVVRAASDDGLGHVVAHLLPRGSSFPALLGIAAVSAVLANVVNNLPATLLLLPIAATGGVGPVLAVLIGVDVGPNLTYAGSLATLLWRRVSGVETMVSLGEFSRLALLTVPVTVVGGTLALWVSIRAVGV